jgi:hypothetical protein
MVTRLELNPVLTFPKALQAFRRDVESRLTQQASQTELQYLAWIYKTVALPGFLVQSKSMPTWAPERYLITHYRTEFLSWLKMQL